MIPEQKDDGYTIRLATVADIPRLMEEDESYRARYALSAFRSEAHWTYQLTEGLKTEYGSAYWIVEHEENGEFFYGRVPREGFGEGLIISEVSEEISDGALTSLFAFCKQKAIAQQKPYIRLNVHNESVAGKTAVSLGAKQGTPYAWQIKFPDIARYLTTIAPLLEQRIQASPFKGFSGTIRLDFYKIAIDLVWKMGVLESVGMGEGECENTFSISADLFPALCLGHRTWQELAYIRPDIFPSSAKNGRLIETLFPSKTAWIHEQY